MRLKSIVCPLLAVAVLTGCASSLGEQATQARTSLIGLSKPDLLSCAGVPQRSVVVNGTEYLTYVSQSLDTRPGTVGVGVGWGVHSRHRVGTGFGFGYPLVAGFAETRTCEATFTVDNGRVSGVNYVGDGAARQGNRQCYFIVESCLTRIGSNRDGPF